MATINLDTKFREFVRFRRTKLGLSQEELAIKIYGNVKHANQRISKIENGTHTPSLDTIEKVLNALESDLNFIEL